MLGTRLGKSRMYRVNIPVTEAHIGKPYPSRVYPRQSVVYTIDALYTDLFWRPTNPLEQAFRDVFGKREIHTDLESHVKGSVTISGYKYTLDPPDVVFLRHWIGGRPVRPYTATIDLYEGAL